MHRSEEAELETFPLQLSAGTVRQQAAVKMQQKDRPSNKTNRFMEQDATAGPHTLVAWPASHTTKAASQRHAYSAVGNANYVRNAHAYCQMYNVRLTRRQACSGKTSQETTDS